MVKLLFNPPGNIVEVQPGTTILEAARKAGLALESPCNGSGVCGKCLVSVAQNLHAYINQTLCKFSHKISKPDTILSCHCTVLETDETIVVNLINTKERGLKIVSQGLKVEKTLAPYITKQYDPFSGRTRVRAGANIILEEAGNTVTSCFGAAVDIGTTTLALALVDLDSGKVLSENSAINPQTRYGHDVLSRISFAATSEGKTLLQKDVVAEINRLLALAADQAKLDLQHVYEIVLSGNTCMMHLVTGHDPTPLGRFPYTPALNGDESFSAAALGLNIAKEGQAYVPALISGFVGADIITGLVATALAELPGTILFIDIGTNGEMVLKTEKGLIATSTAAGPALEGMNIACGMRASAGAIEYFKAEPDGRIEIKTIANAEPTGICGSGLLDIVAELTRAGVIDGSGRFIKPEQAPVGFRERLRPVQGTATGFWITDSVWLTQKDVRQVQLAKAAIRSGIELLLEANQITKDKIDKVIIAGSFGYNVRLECMIQLGLLPQEFKDKVIYAGNTSRSGAELLLINQSARRDASRIARETTALELANNINFQRIFVNSLSLKETR